MNARRTIAGRVPTKAQLEETYTKLLETQGPQNWWPAETPLEMAIGAILTQNTNWLNAEKAIENLRERTGFEFSRLNELGEEEMKKLIRAAGYYNEKTKKLKLFLEYLEKRYEGDITKLSETPLEELRAELLGIWGIGEETADSIILYAAELPIFVVDIYTKRLLRRLGYDLGSGSYEEVQRMFISQLEPDVELFKEFHAQIDIHCKITCKKVAHKCLSCPLTEICPKVY